MGVTARSGPPFFSDCGECLPDQQGHRRGKCEFAAPQSRRHVEVGLRPLTAVLSADMSRAAVRSVGRGRDDEGLCFVGFRQAG